VSHPAQAPYQPYAPVPPHAPPKKGSGLAIASMVLGIIALLFSWVPIINNLAAVCAVVGLGLGIPAILRARRGTHGGTGLAITGLVTSVVALVLVVVTQVLFVKAIDEVQQTLEEGVSSAPADAAAPEPATDDVSDAAEGVTPLGVPAQVGDYRVAVDLVQLDGNAIVAGANQFNEPPTGQYVITQLTVTYTGAEEGNPGWDLTTVFHGSDARQYSDSECSAVLPDDAMDAPTLNPGGTDTFQFCMDVPPAAIQGGQLSVEPTISFDSDSRVYYAIQ
jgi:hypothetical protein